MPTSKAAGEIKALAKKHSKAAIMIIGLGIGLAQGADADLDEQAR